MRPYTSVRADLTRVQLRRDLADELNRDPQWQRAGLGARNSKADELVRAAFEPAEREGTR